MHFVGQRPGMGGWWVMWEGSWHGPYGDVQQAEQQFNTLDGGSSTGSNTGTDIGSLIGGLLGSIGAGGSGVMNVAPMAQLEHEYKLMELRLHQLYLDNRLNLLEIPEMLLANEQQRHSQALNAAMAQAEATGWLNPEDFNTKRMLASTVNEKLLPLLGEQYGKTFYRDAATGEIQTIAQLRERIVAAAGGPATPDGQRWAGASDREIVDEFNRISNGGQGSQFAPYNPFADLAGEYATPTETGPVEAGTNLQLEYVPGVGWRPKSGYVPGGWTPTATGAEMMAQPRGLAENLLMLGGFGATGTAPTQQQQTAPVAPVTSGTPLPAAFGGTINGKQGFGGGNPNQAELQTTTGYGGGVPYYAAGIGDGEYKPQPRVNENLPGDPNADLRTGMVGVSSWTTPPASTGTGLPIDSSSQQAWVSSVMNLIQQRASELGNPNIDLQQLMRDPSQIATVLFQLNFTPQEVGQVLQSAPLTQQLVQGAGGATVNTNPNFSFVQGRQLPVRQMLNAVKTSNPLSKLVTGMAAFSGQDTGNFWGDFQAALPQGGRNPLTRFI
jgi:hypothetical protein